MRVDDPARDDEASYRHRYEVYRAVFALFRAVGDMERPWTTVRQEAAAAARRIATLCEEGPSWTPS